MTDSESLFTNLSHRSVKEIKRSLDFLDNLDLDRITSDQFFEHCKTIFSGLVMPRIISFSPDEKESSEWGIFRARPCKGEIPFENINDFWEPPAELAKVNRCNNAGEPMLYCANHLATALIETGATENSYWSISDFHLPSSKALAGVALGHRGHSFLKQADSSSQIFYDGVSPLLKKKNNLIDDYLHRCFRESVSRNKNIYTKTIGITKYLMHPEANTDVAALFYPSVASGLKGGNIVFEPKSARNALILKKAYFVKVTSLDLKKGKIDLHFIAVGDPLKDKVIWAFGNP